MTREKGERFSFRVFFFSRMILSLPLQYAYLKQEKSFSLRTYYGFVPCQFISHTGDNPGIIEAKLNSGAPNGSFR